MGSIRVADGDLAGRARDWGQENLKGCKHMLALPKAIIWGQGAKLASKTFAYPPALRPNIAGVGRFHGHVRGHG
ncbi:hypothetical protein A7A08_02505 [Methyloligella halotolerans]|uniref:Uncharacterized protein n=1 Tax=Methyloligella halotolerans TaxID=1177755 RepID=A0A1E2RWX8_9HYPH|nr:hypothetical protein A7A08_02505 [Methyloligella halotolerans]